MDSSVSRAYAIILQSDVYCSARPPTVHSHCIQEWGLALQALHVTFQDGVTQGIPTAEIVHTKSLGLL